MDKTTTRSKKSNYWTYWCVFFSEGRSNPTLKLLLTAELGRFSDFSEYLTKKLGDGIDEQNKITDLQLSISGDIDENIKSE